MTFALPKKAWINITGYTYLYGGSNLVLKEGWLSFTCEVICTDGYIRSGSGGEILVPMTQVLMIQSYPHDWTKGTIGPDGKPIPFKEGNEQ